MEKAKEREKKDEKSKMQPIDEAEADLPRKAEIVAAADGRDEYKVCKLLGKGTFGCVYAVNRLKDGKTMAMKCEHVSVKKQVLTMECSVLEEANAIKSPHFCTVIDKGRIPNQFVFICMTLLGKNLWDLRRDREAQKFSIGTALKVAEQSLQSIRDLHKIGYLHRDIKPPNFTIGLDADLHKVFIIDFGLCRQFKEDGKEIRNQRKVAPFRGTARYAPLTAHRNEDQSRRDDLEGWLYMVIEFTAGRLPWRHLKSSERDMMLAMKEDCRRGVLLQQLLEDCPFQAYSRILKYLDQLIYKDIPDYDYVWKMLDIAMEENCVKYSDPVDWDRSHAYTGPRYVPERKFD